MEMQEIQTLIENLNFSNNLWVIFTPLILMGLDIITGYIQALINKEVKSSIMRQGIMHKILLIITLVIGFVLDFTFNFKFMAKAIAVYLIIMEVTSIVENLKKGGIDLTNILNFLKSKNK